MQSGIQFQGRTPNQYDSNGARKHCKVRRRAMAREKRADDLATDARTSRRPSTRRLAKLSRPQLSGAVPRLRLFKLLDDSSTKPLIWIHGPPGAGKTTVVASYLSVKKISGIWYQIDRDDADLASFFYYLGLAAPTNSRRKRPAMPLLTPEYLPDLEGFARKFFRELYARLAASSVVVLDNHQEVTGSSGFQKVIALAASEAPPGVRVMVLSRAEPSREYARLLANGSIAQIGWDELRLTLEETTRIAAQRQPLSADLVESLHVQCDGWVAGMVLLLERLRHDAKASDFERVEWPETIFNYFTGQVFGRLSSETRDFLLRTAMLPQVTARLAEALTGRNNAQQVLENLYRHQFFVDRRGPGGDPWYQYHALFRVFLIHEARTVYPLAEWKGLLQVAADALVAHGRAEEAVPILIEAEAWETAAGLILAQAQELLDRGRWQTLQHWIQSLPERFRQSAPWLGFWLGMCRLRIAPAESRAHLESAFAVFEQMGDRLGQALSATAIIEAHVNEWIDYHPLDAWIAQLEAILTEGRIVFPTPDIELAVRASLFNAMVQRQSYREDLRSRAEELAEMLRQNLNPNYILLAARALFVFSVWYGDFSLTERVVTYIQPALNAPGVAPLNRLWYFARLGFASRYSRPPKEVQGMFAEALKIARTAGLRFVEAPVAFLWAWASDALDDVPALEEALRTALDHLDPASHFGVGYSDVGKAFRSVRRHDDESAARELQEAVAFFRQSGSTLSQGVCLLGLAAVLLGKGAIDAARAALEEELALTISGPLARYLAALLEAAIALTIEDRKLASERLRFALALGAKHGFERVGSEYMFRRNFPGVCAVALEQGIECAYVTRLVRSQRLIASSADIEQWPWPVRIHLLGRFTVHVDDEPLIFSGKGPKKPLELLKALVAVGGHMIDVGWLAEQLWPDADAVRNVFNVTHARLRKLLPVEDVFLLDEGKLSLNTTRVWTDVGALERVADHCSVRLRQDPLPAEMTGLSETLLSLYGGELLKGEMDAPWLIAARDRVRNKFLRTLKLLGAYWEGQKAWGPALNLYERALEIDNVAEDIYRHLIRCNLQAGQPAEALRAYRRCCQMLSLVLGIAPSAETVALLEDIRAD
jgi:LuxR family transcriptional regulator, maltose regulon positive regulatory protein